MPVSATPDARAPDLRALFPDDPEEAEKVPEAARGRFEAHWQALRDLGFHVLLRKDALVVRHPGRGFEMEIQLSREDDLGEKRELFRALRATFGSPMERWLPILVQSSPAVTRPYQSLKGLVEVCQAVRRKARA